MVDSLWEYGFGVYSSENAAFRAIQKVDWENLQGMTLEEIISDEFVSIYSVEVED
jgi:hypothetical protein